MPPRVVVGMTGATGQIYGVRAIGLLDELGFESHLIVSDAARVTARHELADDLQRAVSLATHVHQNKNIGGPTASGSFRTAGMLIAPCSMKTLANVARGNAANLITRSADVTLKEQRPLVVLPREKPFNRIHLRNMLELTDAGGIVYPPFPSHYQRDADLDEMITRSISRALSYLDEVDIDYKEWSGLDGGADDDSR